MKILVNPFYFNIEFNETTVREDIIHLGKEMDSFFENKSYSPLVERLVMVLFCNFPFAKPYKRPQYLENVLGNIPYTNDTFPIYHELHVDIVIGSFDALVVAKGPEVAAIIGKEVIAYFEQVKLPMKIRKSFDKKRFIEDLRTFFDSKAKVKSRTSDED